MRVFYVSFYLNANEADWMFEACAARSEDEAKSIVAKHMQAEHDLDIYESGIIDAYPLVLCNAYEIEAKPTT